MKNIFNIFKFNKKQNSDFNIDQILDKNSLAYSDLSFETDKSDILRSYNSINQKLGNRSHFLKNIKNIISHFDLTPILKPVYTIVLTSIIIVTIILLKDSTNQVQFAEITDDQGEKITLHVTEDLTIYLNSGSSIKIPLELKRNAKIYFDGEAYFQVTRDKKTTVIANGIVFETKNSNFHINTKDQNLLVTHVKKGEVEFYNPDLPKQTKFTLTNNDKAIYNPVANFIAVEKENSTNYLAWHTGIMKFNQTPLYSAIDDLSNYFEIPMQIKNTELSTQKITAQYTDLEIDHILDKIQSQFNCQISADGSKIIIH